MQRLLLSFVRPDSKAAFENSILASLELCLRLPMLFSCTGRSRGLLMYRYAQAGAKTICNGCLPLLLTVFTLLSSSVRLQMDSALTFGSYFLSISGTCDSFPRAAVARDLVPGPPHKSFSKIVIRNQRQCFEIASLVVKKPPIKLAKK